jgi:hypothetical protein
MKGVDEVIVSLEWRHAVGFGRGEKGKSKSQGDEGCRWTGSLVTREAEVGSGIEEGER